MILLHGPEKARPARARIKLMTTLKEGEFASRAVVDPFLMVVVEHAAEGGFGAVRAENLELGWGEHLLPLGLGLYDFVLSLGADFFDGAFHALIIVGFGGSGLVLLGAGVSEHRKGQQKEGGLHSFCSTFVPASWFRLVVIRYEWCMSRSIDLRSDTVTQPTPEMLEAMRSAPLGDDVLGHDPTTLELEEECASLLGHEAGLFCPSGTMTNQVALATWCRPGDSALFEEEAHMVFYEGGAPAALSGVMTITCPSEQGVMSVDTLEQRFLVGSMHTPGTTLLCIENTHNRTGGRVISVEQTRAYATFAQAKGIPLHLDGARVCNAATALGVDVRDLTAPCDSVSICLSKGLGAPVGSVLCGSRDFIDRAKFVRKRFGGGMRQSGVLAAAGLVALRVQRHVLGEDHRRARELAQSLVGLAGARVDPSESVTNFVFVHTDLPAAEWSAALRERGVLCLPAAPHRIRLMLHHQISDADVAATAEAFHAVAGSLCAVRNH